MKTTIFTLLAILFFAHVSTAQKLTKDTYLAVKNDNVSALKSQLSTNNYNTCYKVKDTYYTLLSLTIKADANNCFDFLVSQKSTDINKNCTGKTPLLYAAKYGKLEMLKKLLSNGADINYKNKGRSVMDYAKKYEQEDIINFLKNN